ncbi:MAG: murein L,D-transpeptidase [Actinobacteria bacterium]|nr:murein L,D-transpeptidase [Actinomycetota bacterium]
MGSVLATAAMIGVTTPTTSAASAAPLHMAPAYMAPVRTAQTVLAAPTPAAPTTRPRFYRETVRFGARDTSPYDISHVFEVQIRLTRSGVYHGPITGYFGSATLAAVRAFQGQQRLPRTGVVDQPTWQHLIGFSILRSPGWFQLPSVCRSAGWHSCYSRSTNELFAFYSGTLWNTWLVRGGAAGLETVPGTRRVYWQDATHRSTLFNGAPMPYSQFFYGGEAIHGSGTMMDPLSGHSHGCINMYVEDAAELWQLTAHRTHTVTVYGAWR